MRLRGKPAPARRPPGPDGQFLLGNLLDFGRDVLGFFTDCARRHGDVVALRLGAWPTLLLSHPDHAELVLVKQHENFIKHKFFWRHVRALFGEGLLTSEGEFWHRERRLVAPAFHGQRLAAYGGVMVDDTERMLGSWQAGGVCDVHEEMMALTLRIAAKTLFDADVDRDVAEIGQRIDAIVEEVGVRFRRPFMIPDGIPLPGNIRYLRGVRRIDRMVGRIVEERHADGRDRGDLLSMLLLARDDEGGRMSARQVRDEVVTLLLAGHETTALVLSWTWYLLSRHEAVEAELADELKSVLGGRAPTVEDLPRLRFTEQVVTEAMRLYPPAWALGREAIAACEIGGYEVPAGTTIFISPWVLHRDPRFYDRPEDFDPARWSGDLARRLPRFAYLPFGGGPRICIGNRFAMIESVLILATIAQRFRLQWQGDRPIVPLASITLRPQGGVWTKLAARAA